MDFLLSKKANDSVEWLVTAVLVVAVAGSMIYSIVNAANVQGANTNTWISGIPAPTTP